MDKIEKIPIPEDVKRVLDNVSHILIGLNYRETARDYKQAVEKLISLLEAEDPDKSLEEAARHSEILTYPMPEDGDIEKVMKVQEARIFHEIGFKAGAEWKEQQMLKESPKKEIEEFMSHGDRAIIDELYRWRFTTICQEYINQGIFDYGCAKHFAEWQKEQMLKDAVEGTVHANTNARWIEAEVSREDGFICGQKVRIVVLKEEE